MNTEFRPEKLLCVVAHPDDIEVTIGGTIAKWAAAGTEVSLLVCTDGANGTADLGEAGEKIATIRAREQHAAADVLGISCWHQLSFPDGSIQASDDLCVEIVRYIRAHKPDTVFTMDPTFLYSTEHYYPNHRDHRVVGQSTFDAVYPRARDIGSFPELLEEQLEPHIVQTLLMTNYEKQNYYVDISDSFDTKIAALKTHVSQFGDGEGVSAKLAELCDSNGDMIGASYAEAFVKLDIFEPRS